MSSRRRRQGTNIKVSLIQRLVFVSILSCTTSAHCITRIWDVGQTFCKFRASMSYTAYKSVEPMLFHCWVTVWDIGLTFYQQRAFPCCQLSWVPSKRKTQYCFNAGPSSTTLGQRYNNLVWSVLSVHCWLNVGPPSPTLDQHWANNGSVFAGLPRALIIYYGRELSSHCLVGVNTMIHLHWEKADTVRVLPGLSYPPSDLYRRYSIIQYRYSGIKNHSICLKLRMYSECYI